MTLKELRQVAKEKGIHNWWNKNTQQLTDELKALEAPEPAEVKKRNKVLVGDNISLANYCKENDLPYFTIYDRINRLHWDVEKAISTPVRIKRKKAK